MTADHADQKGRGIGDLLSDRFIVKHGTGHKPAYGYYEEEPGRRSTAKLLSLARPAALSEK
jgi:hypothetical protein